jgi:hypothetical protein
MLHRDTDDANGVLAGRVAATLVSHDPGWRLPRPSEIARRHNVPVDDVHAAIRELVGRNLIRQAPDGYLYLTGPAEYRASLEGITGLSTHVDPMGGNLTCTSYGVSRQAVSTDAASALRVEAGSQVGVLRLAWALNGAPAAMSTTYLTGDILEPEALDRWLADKAERGELPIPSPGPVPADPVSLPEPPAGPLESPSKRESPAGLGPLADEQWRKPHAVSVQMQLPSASAARRLRLNPGQMALIVTMLFCDGPEHQPAALTVTVLRPDLFRVRLETPQAGLDGERLQAALALGVTD